jgi:serine/threonine-protein kinase
MPGLGGTTNNYEILAQLASGGMAEIFLARVTAVAGVERHVVLKRILPAYRDDQQFVTMFLDEARLQAQLRHPNIAQLHDVGRLGSSYFYTMEYVHGETVQSLMARAAARREPIPLQHVLTIAAGVSAALHHAHTRRGSDRKPLGIVHRDVSPANIMITFDGAVKLLDFGVAKSSNRQMKETRAGVVKGKVAYLAPEQIGGQVLDGRCDLFSLGICLYELLTLHSLFTRESDLSTLAAIIQEQVPAPSYFRKDVPPEIDALVMTALAKDRDLRFRDADAMHEAVEHAATATKLSMSPSSLGRYLVKLFGQRAEPWLEEGGPPVTVVGDIIEPTQGVMPIDAAQLAAAENLEVRIKTVKPITLRAPNKDDLGFDDENPFEDGQTTVPRQPKPRATLPMASAHPGWEATVARTPLPEGLDLERSRHRLEDFSSQVATPVALPVVKPSLSAPPPSHRAPPSFPVPPPSIAAPLHPVEPARPSAPAHRVQSGTHAGWLPLMVCRLSPPPPHSPQEPGTSWNIPRLIMAVAVLIAIVVGLWLALG